VRIGPFNQTIDIQTATPKKFKVVASVKVETDEARPGPAFGSERILRMGRWFF
jgi:hypothetical protein